MNNQTTVDESILYRRQRNVSLKKPLSKEKDTRQKKYFKKRKSALLFCKDYSLAVLKNLE